MAGQGVLVVKVVKLGQGSSLGQDLAVWGQEQHLQVFQLTTVHTTSIISSMLNNSTSQRYILSNYSWLGVYIVRGWGYILSNYSWLGVPLEYFGKKTCTFANFPYFWAKIEHFFLKFLFFVIFRKIIA